jgi:O-antigen/teichoic acid export membrane protein
MDALRQLHRRSWAATVFLILLTGSGMALLGPWIAHLWLSKSNVFNGQIFYTLILVTMVSAIWNSNSVVLAATNSHARLGIQYVVANAVCLGLGAMLAKHFGISSLLACLVLAEVVLLILVAPQAIAKTEDTLPAFLRQALQFKPSAQSTHRGPA